jgi:hypothetical protein
MAGRGGSTLWAAVQDGALAASGGSGSAAVRSRSACLQLHSIAHARSGMLVMRGCRALEVEPSHHLAPPAPSSVCLLSIGVGKEPTLSSYLGLFTTGTMWGPARFSATARLCLSNVPVSSFDARASATQRTELTHAAQPCLRVHRRSCRLLWTRLTAGAGASSELHLRLLQIMADPTVQEQEGCCSLLRHSA